MPSSCEPRARVVLRPGPINFIDLHPRVATELPHGVNASFDWIFQWRESLRGGVYSVPGFLLILSGKSNGRFVGHRPGSEVRWQANRHLWFQADYGIFLRRQVCERKSVRPQPRLLGSLDRIQVLGSTFCKSASEQACVCTRCSES